MKKSSLRLILFLIAVMFLFVIKFFLIKPIHNDESKLSEEFVEYGKYDELRNSVPSGGWEYDTVIGGIKVNETNIIRRKNYFEINTSVHESNQKVFVYSMETDDEWYFNNLTLETNKKKVVTSIGTLAKYDNNRIYFEDLNRDGRKEICLTTDQGGGTGLNILRLHVFDAESLEEYKIEDPVSYVEALYTFEETGDGIHLEKPVYITIDIPNFLFANNAEFETTEFAYDDPETGLYNQIDIDGIYSVDDTFVLDEYSLGLLGYNELTVLEYPDVRYKPTYLGGIISKTKQGYNYLYQISNISTNESMDNTSFIIDALIQIAPTSVIKLSISMDIRYLDIVPCIIQSIEYKGEI